MIYLLKKTPSRLAEQFISIKGEGFVVIINVILSHSLIVCGLWFVLVAFPTGYHIHLFNHKPGY